MEIFEAYKNFETYDIGYLISLHHNLMDNITDRNYNAAKLLQNYLLRNNIVPIRTFWLNKPIIKSALVKGQSLQIGDVVRIVDNIIVDCGNEKNATHQIIEMYIFTDRIYFLILRDFAGYITTIKYDKYGN